VPVPGSLDDESIIRQVLTESIRRSSKSREEIVAEMSALTAQKITLRMLNAYASGSEEQHRWPMQFTRAFCYVVNDWALLQCIVEGAKCRMICESESDLLELGRQYLRQKRASEQVQHLEKRLGGIEP
jgi:hypothetical protein